MAPMVSAKPSTPKSWVQTSQMDWSWTPETCTTSQDAHLDTLYYRRACIPKLRQTCSSEATVRWSVRHPTERPSSGPRIRSGMRERALMLLQIGQLILQGPPRRPAAGLKPQHPWSREATLDTPLHEMTARGCSPAFMVTHAPASARMLGSLPCSSTRIPMQPLHVDKNNIGLSSILEADGERVPECNTPGRCAVPCA
jgi:hypothetical protein